MPLSPSAARPAQVPTLRGWPGITATISSVLSHSAEYLRMNPRYGLFKRSKLCALIIRVIFLETIVGGASPVSENGFLNKRRQCARTT